MTPNPQSSPHTAPQAAPVSLPRLLFKAAVLFVIANLLYALLNPTPALGRLSAYNHIFPGRTRFPYADDPARAFSLSLFSLEAMFASHEIAASRPVGEFRIVLVGDSSTWGFLLEPEDTLAARLNARNLVTAGGHPVRFYNLGYPTLSLTKDLLVIDEAMHSEPDLVIWLITLESFPADKQLSSPLVQHNPQRLDSLAARYPLGLDLADPGLVRPTFYDRTIVGQRRPLADLFRLQLYGALWAATGVDQVYPAEYDLPQRDFEPDPSFHGLAPAAFDPHTDLAWDVFSAGLAQVGSTPVLVVNEPMYISDGQNSDIRYNFFYPRWAYDAYRQSLAQASASGGWAYLDAWDLVPPGEFTNQAIHLTPAGEDLLADRVAQALEPLLQGE